MSGRVVVGRVLIAAGALLVLLFGLIVPTSGHAAVPVPQATTATPGSSPSPSPSESDTDVEPTDEPTDDGSNVTPDQTGTWVAVGGAAAISVLAGLVVVLRKR